ncbi:MAG: 30S ribosomal protein S3 [Nanoarchaeota archaeon]|nr:30S ribosomal protein S3 [Nanoarchaeota archaeon]MBU4283793.1 30S ribosomal protein S3 [Nanoarchaeota archaeon]MBU4493593.1 30S ribosomal protein S3 [Nanoarchaeota archaeon]
MIERQIVAQKKKEYQIQEMIAKNVKGSGYSHTKLQRTPLGEKIIIYAARPGLIVGRKGQNITKLTKNLKNSFELENPQIEINEIENINLNAQVVAGKISESLERFGTARFKGIMHKTMEEVMSAGALGIEIVISGKIPGARAKSWRVYSGYLKKCGDIAITGVNKAKIRAVIKTGVVGVKVSIMPPDIKLPDNIQILEEKQEIIEEIKEEKPVKEEAEKKEENPAKASEELKKKQGKEDNNVKSKKEKVKKEIKKTVKKPAKKDQKAPKK